MKHETSIIYSKYSYFLILLFDQRDYLFNKFDDELSFEIFFENHNYVIKYGNKNTMEKIQSK